MRYLFYILSLLIVTISSLPVAGFGQSSGSSDSIISSQLEIAQELHMSGEEQKSLNIYKDVLSKDPENINALWNAAVLHTKIGHRQNSKRSMRRHYKMAQDLSERAVRNHPESGQAYYAMAVSIARMTELMGPGGKLDASRKVKENIEKASELIPDFAPVWHLYGVWHSDVANMSGLAKTAAGLFSGGVPDASNDKAEEYLEKATSMDKDNILFHIDFAKHYLKVDRRGDARDLLLEILNMEPHMKDDPGYIEEAEQLLNEIQ
jgi:tetratricopeptide (TPR) repeat protein